MALRPHKITMDAVWHTRVSVLRIPVVRAALHYPDGIAIYLAYDAVAVIDPPAPIAWKLSCQSFGLSDTIIAITFNVFKNL